MLRNVLHCDMNNFYASVECMLDPALREYPVAVCGSVEERHGIVLAKNYKAKAFNVQTGDAVWQAKQKCKDLVIVPPHFEEAAMIDGATRMQRLFKITIPNMMPSITICTFLTITNSFKLFDQNLALTGGEPLHKTEMLALNIYSTFYGRVGAEGVGQAKAVVFFIIVVAIGLLQLKLTRDKEVQQ